jgi:hypothetical protein
MKWLMLIPMTVLLMACEPKGPIEQTGEEIDEAVEDMKAGGETTGNKIDDALDDVSDDVDDATN